MAKLKKSKSKSKKKGKIGSTVDSWRDESFPNEEEQISKYNVCITFAPVMSEVNVRAGSKKEAIRKVKEMLGDHILDIIEDEDVWELTESR